MTRSLFPRNRQRNRNGRTCRHASVFSATCPDIESLESRLLLSAPLNDNFADAFPLLGSTAISSVRNDGATAEPGEPLLASGKTLWWTWTAPRAGPVTLETMRYNSSFSGWVILLPELDLVPSLLNVYTGSSLSNLISIAGRDSSSSTLTFDATAATTYYFVLDTLGSSAGAFNLRLDQASSDLLAPTSLQATLLSTTHVNLTWSDTSSDETRFRIERKDADSWREIATVPANVTRYDDCDVDSKSTHVYRVRAANSLGLSAFSNEAFLSQPPANDSFSNALPLVGSSVTVDATNCGATSEPGEPIDPWGSASTVWWTWTAPWNGRVRIETIGQSLGCDLNIFTGSVVSALTRVTGAGPSFGFDAIAGAVYHLSIDGRRGQTGPFSLRLELESPELNAPLNLLATASSPGRVNLRWTDYSSNETAFRIERTAFSWPSVWTEIATVSFDVTAYEDIGLSFNTVYAYRVRASTAVANSAFAGEHGDVTVRTLAPPPVNDSFAAPLFLSGPAVTVIGTTRGATTEPNEPLVSYNAQHTIWWRWIAPWSGPVTLDTAESDPDLLLRVFTGSSLTALTLIRATDETSSASVSFTAVAGTLYHLSAESYLPRDLTLRVELGRPELASPTSLSATPVSASRIDLAWTDNSTHEIGFKIERRSNNLWKEIVTVGPNVTSYQDTSDLVPMRAYGYRVRACTAAANSAFSNEADAATLVPGNDQFENAAALTGPSATITEAMRGATAQPGEPPYPFGPAASLWWTWTAPYNGPVQIDTLGSDFDTVLFVYNGPSVASLTWIASDDQSGDGDTSLLTFDATANTTYRIAVSGYRADDSGFLTLRLNQTASSLPSFATLSNGLLTVTGTSRNDTIHLIRAGTQLIARLNNVPQFFPSGSVSALRLFGLAGNDILAIDSSIRIPATICGGNGNDSLFGGAGNDLLDGGFASDFLAGGPGIDTVTYASRKKPLNLSINNKADDGEARERDTISTTVENLIGGAGADLIVGSAFANRLDGGPGNDTIRGGAGNDSVYGGTGRDDLYGDAGANVFYARDKAVDRLWGGAGKDTAQVDKTDLLKSIESLLK